MSGISLKNVELSLGGVRALDGLSIDIADGEFAALVGPSGCGKSAALRAIAGLDRLKSGAVLKDGEDITALEPKDRDMAMVFESYALYPDKTVYDNLAFGLKLRKIDKTEIRARVTEAAKIVGITDLLDKKPKALSPMDVKRAELARVAVRRPSVFLLDEPLGALDGKDRIDALLLIRRLWQTTGVTFVYATRSFEDAAALGATVSVLNGGMVVQTGTSRELAENPIGLFVARVCSPILNVFEAEVETEGGKAYARFCGGRLELCDECNAERALVAARPEDISVSKTPTDGLCMTAAVDAIERLGAESVLYMCVEGKLDYVVARVNGCEYRQGDNVLVRFDSHRLAVFDAETERAIKK